MPIPSPRSPAAGPAPGDAILSAFAGAVLAGIGVGLLTLRLNPQLLSSLTDRLLVLFYGATFYGLLGAGVGFLGAGFLLFARRRRGRASRLFRGILLSVLGFSPLLGLLLLPGMQVGGHLLTDVIFGGGVGGRFLAIVSLAGVAALCGLAFESLRRRWFHWGGRRVYATLTLALAVGAVAYGALLAAPSEAAPARRAEGWPPRPSEPPTRVILLCVDGLDPGVVFPLVERGELPTLGRFVREGAWGPLRTLEPTLSAVVWTTIATGKEKAEHGIHHFVTTQLPGVHRPILEFPLHSGLNFGLLSRLGRLPGFPELQRPYTSSQRRAEALWNIAGRYWPVGVWRWLISWPPEEVPGFYVSGGVGWAQIDDAEERKAARQHSRFPADAYRGLDLSMPNPREALAELAPEGLEIELEAPRWRPVRGMVRDRVRGLLPGLVEKYDPRFVAAAFYNIDTLHHFYHGETGLAGELIPAAYRFVDARLGELMARLDDDTQWIVISDHGFDFEHGHHAFAPPGTFLALGPAFPHGRKVEGLSVFDIAPLVLRLLGLPLGEDLPGTAAGRYQEALAPGFLAAHPESRIPSWEPAVRGEATPDSAPVDEELREVLESLGYL